MRFLPSPKFLSSRNDSLNWFWYIVMMSASSFMNRPASTMTALNSTDSKLSPIHDVPAVAMLSG